jgi:hypothetical protein
LAVEEDDVAAVEFDDVDDVPGSGAVGVVVGEDAAGAGG